MTVLVGYAREIKRDAPLDEQVNRLMGVGIPPRLIFKDALPKGRKPLSMEQRDHCIKSLREGEMLVVDGLYRLGADIDDLIVQIKAVADRGAFIRDLAVGRDFPHETAIALAGGEMILEAKKAYLSQTLKGARAAKRLQGKKPRAPSGVMADKKLVPQIRADWNNLELSQNDVAKKWKVDERTLKARFGPRKLPETVEE